MERYAQMIGKMCILYEGFWTAGSEERGLIISFFIVKYSSVQEGFLLVLLNRCSGGKW